MTKAINKIKDLTKKECYKYGYDNGFGRGLGIAIGFLRKEIGNTIDKDDIEKLIQYAVETHKKDWEKKRRRNIDGF